MVNSFHLDDKAKFKIISETGANLNIPRWQYPQHYITNRYALILAPEESLQVDSTIKIGQSTSLYLRYGTYLSSTKDNSFICRINFIPSKQSSSINIAVFRIEQFFTAEDWRSATIDISWLHHYKEGRFVISFISPVKELNQYLAISDFVIGESESIHSIKQKAFHHLRSENEKKHFEAVYDHSKYEVNSRKTSLVSPSKIRVLDKCATKKPKKAPVSINKISINSGESVFDFSRRLLVNNLDQKFIDYSARIKDKVSTYHRPIKILSICSGDAKMEGQWSAEFGDGIQWSLMDSNAKLLSDACNNFPADVKLDLIEADINSVHYTGETWDVILCASKLHHLTNLENVFSFVNRSLFTEGEFWVLGGQVGKNGNRLWSEALFHANKIFSKIPARLRLNAYTQKIDDFIPDADYSALTFEGIRSEEIEQLLANWFLPNATYKINCFLWRLVNLDYINNFDLANAEDVSVIYKMVNAELEYYTNGGRPTELFGVYTPKRLP